METKTIQFQNQTISYKTGGQGYPVLLLHGFGEDSRIWDNQAEVLEKICYLIIPDLPGSGGSPFAKDISNNIDVMAAAMMAVVNAECSDPPIILGHSMGGYIMMAMIDKYPGAFKAIGLVHSTAAADDDEKKASRKKAIGFVQENGAFAFLKTAIPNLFSKAYQEAGKAVVDDLIAKAMGFTDEAVIAYYEAMIARPDRTHLLHDLTIPVLFVLGTEDGAVPMDKVMPQTHMADTSFVHVLQGCGHMGMLEAAAKCNEILEAFVRKNAES